MCQWYMVLFTYFKFMIDSFAILMSVPFFPKYKNYPLWSSVQTTYMMTMLYMSHELLLALSDICAIQRTIKLLYSKYLCKNWALSLSGVAHKNY